MLASYESLLQLHPDYHWAINNIISGLNRLGRFEEATPPPWR